MNSQQAPTAQHPMAADPRPPTQSLEQRLYELLLPFRDDCYSPPSVATSSINERKCLILCENLAFILRHNQSSYGKDIQADDISMVSRNWGLMMAGGTNVAGVGIFVIGNGYTHNVVRVLVRRGEREDVVSRLTEYVDNLLENFFTGS